MPRKAKVIQQVRFNLDRDNPDEAALGDKLRQLAEKGKAGEWIIQMLLLKTASPNKEYTPSTELVQSSDTPVTKQVQSSDTSGTEQVQTAPNKRVEPPAPPPRPAVVGAPDRSWRQQPHPVPKPGDSKPKRTEVRNVDVKDEA